MATEKEIADSLAQYEAERAKVEPEYIAGELTTAQYREQTAPLWDAHLARVNGEVKIEKVKEKPLTKKERDAIEAEKNAADLADEENKS